MKSLLFFAFSLHLFEVICANKDGCTLPDGCSIETLKYKVNLYGFEKMTYNFQFNVTKCYPHNENYQFKFIENDFMKGITNNSQQQCRNNGIKGHEIILFQWPRSVKKQIILDTNFGLSNVIRYMDYFSGKYDIYLINVRGIEINLSENNKSLVKENKGKIISIMCIACKLEFYTKGKLIKSCRDISESNSTIESIFQINYDAILIQNNQYSIDLCPLVFKNAYIGIVAFIGLADTFYKRNTFKFTTDMFSDLNSSIYLLELPKVENIKLDLTILNPSVFSRLHRINILESIKSIDKSIFSMLASLKEISISPMYFRKLIHENGIDWIKEININQTKIDVRNKSEVYKIDEFEISIKGIFIDCNNFTLEEPLFKVLPDKDFCIYRDFPFDQLIMLIQYCDDLFQTINIKTEEFTCTYLWLNQYIEFYFEFFQHLQGYPLWQSVKKVIESKEYSEISKCDFEHRLELCNKTNYQIKNIWSNIDYYYLNKRFQSGIKITSYFISLFGFITNLFVIILILIKSNTDLFKEFKQYNYLCINSMFCLMILVINILSWTTECFYPYEVFCPEIRKVVFFQFFKVIFKECFTTTFRFMLNFSYVAFSLNRIVTIRKEQNKFFMFISEVSIKWYIAVTLLISAGLSSMKFFKYEINYEYPTMNYPISNEWDIFDANQKQSHAFDDAYFIVNSISDIINYVLFVLICIFIDIYMIYELRQVMNEKLEKIKRLYSQSQSQQSKSKIESTKKENEEAINKVIKMIVINTAIGLLFKMPSSFIPVLNVYAEFYYKDFNMKYKHPAFGRFYSSIFYSGYYGEISDIAEFLFILSIFIQPFIYKQFDKKFQTAFQRLLNKNQEANKNKPKSTSTN